MYVILIVLMIGCFFLSGLFFMDSGLVDPGTGIDNENSIRILAELDALPMVQIEPYDINFYRRGELTGIGNGSLTIASYRENGDTFLYPGNTSVFRKGEWLRIYYRYLPEGGKRIFKVERIRG